MNINKKLNILFERGGTCQSERLLPQLVHNNDLISDQRLGDHIRFLYLYSDLITYYNSNNEPVRDNAWRSFLECDDTVISSLITHTNTALLKTNIHKYFFSNTKQLYLFYR